MQSCLQLQSFPSVPAIRTQLAVGFTHGTDRTLQRLKFQNFFVIINRDLKAADILACIKLYRNSYDVSRYTFLIIYMKHPQGFRIDPIFVINKDINKVINRLIHL